MGIRFKFLVLAFFAVASSVNAVDLGQCLTLSTANTVYTLNQSVASDASCMNVTAENVTLDCNGYGINYSSSSTGYGVQSNSTNTTVQNCSFINQTGTSTYSYGIYFDGAGNGIVRNNGITTLGIRSHCVESMRSNDSVFSNNTLSASANFTRGFNFSFSSNNQLLNNNASIVTPYYCTALSFRNCSNNTVSNNSFYVYCYDGAGLDDVNSSNNTFSHNNVSTVDFQCIAFYLSGSNNETVYNNTVTTNGASNNGVHLLNSNYVNVTGNTVTTNGASANCIHLLNSNYANVAGNNATAFSSGGGIVLINSDYNDVSNNDFSAGADGAGSYFSGSDNNDFADNDISTAGGGSQGVYFASGSNNNFTRTSISTAGAGSQGIRFSGSTGNLFTDSFVNAVSSNDVYSSTSGINNFTNCTFNKSDSSISSTGSINVFWYVDVRTTDNAGSDLGSVTINESNVNGTSIYNGTTNATGWLDARQTILEYFQNATSVYNATPHWFNASLAGYYANNSQHAVSSGLFGGGALSIVLARPASIGEGIGGGSTPTPAPTASVTPTPTVSPTVSPSASPTVSLTPVPSVKPSVEPTVEPSVGASVAPTPMPTGVEPTMTAVERNNIFGALEVSGLTGGVNSCNSTVCRAGEAAKVVVRRVIEVIQTPDGVLTRVTLHVSNEGKAAAFGVSVSEFVDSISKGGKVVYSSLPQRFFEGSAEWVIDFLSPGSQRDFSYGVFRQATQAELADSRPPVVSVRSVETVSGKPDYNLFYAALVVLVAAAVAWAFSRRPTRKR